MSWERDVLAASVDELVSRNSPQLLATLLQDSCRKYLETLERHNTALAAIATRLTDDQRIGEAVRSAAQRGRKTVRVADLIEPA